MIFVQRECYSLARVMQFASTGNTEKVLCSAKKTFLELECLEHSYQQQIE